MILRFIMLDATFIFPYAEMATGVNALVNAVCILMYVQVGKFALCALLDVS